MTLSGIILKLFGWKVTITVPDYPKAIICVAPHTSNWDFFWGKLAYWSVHRKTYFLMKESWFVFPIGWIFRALGGIPVSRKNSKSSLTSQIVERFKESTRLTLAITPEGTRSYTTTWHTGFLHIAFDAKVPIVLGAFDYKYKTITIEDTFHPTGDIEKDLRCVKDYFKKFNAKFPSKFTTN